MPSRLPSLIVVKRDEKALYWALRKQFEGQALVLLDWRGGQRRADAVAIEPDRSRGERRESLPPTEVQRWKDSGHCLIRKAEGFQSDEAERRLRIARP